jgi:hypothetical protein
LRKSSYNAVTSAGASDMFWRLGAVPTNRWHLLVCIYLQTGFRRKHIVRGMFVAIGLRLRLCWKIKFFYNLTWREFGSRTCLRLHCKERIEMEIVNKMERRNALFYRNWDQMLSSCVYKETDNRRKCSTVIAQNFSVFCEVCTQGACTSMFVCLLVRPKFLSPIQLIRFLLNTELWGGGYLHKKLVGELSFAYRTNFNPTSYLLELKSEVDFMSSISSFNRFIKNLKLSL